MTLALWNQLAKGLGTTLQLFAIVLILSIPLGFLVALLRIYSPKFLQWIIEAYIYVMRGTPLLLQLMVIFFILPQMGIVLSRFPSALIAFVLNYAAYFAEIFRGGILAIPPGQFEAIKVLGIGEVRGYIRIIIPQVFNVVLPSLGNEVITLIKDTSLVHVLGIGELLRAGQIAANAQASLTPFLAVGIIYLGLTAVVTYLLRKIEKGAAF